MWYYIRSLPGKLRLFRQLRKQAKLGGWGNRFPSETYNKYGPDSTFHGARALNIGCGLSVYRAENVENVDCEPGDGVNRVIRLGSGPLPYKDEEFDFILANHVIEHVPNWWDCFQELARVLKPGGRIEVWIPPVSSDSCFTYRDHINRIGILSFSGVMGMERPGTNLWAAANFPQATHLQRLKMVGWQARPILEWWMFLAPQWLADWCARHLRNTVTEEGFFFQKLAEGSK